MPKYIMSFDSGTTSCRAIIFNKKGKVIASAQKEFKQIYPKPGWVEHDPMEIWGTQSGVAREVLELSGIRPAEIAAIGITNQRETTVLWDKNTGKPIYNAIVWQCRRTTDICNKLIENGWENKISYKTGLVIDAYFSATKIAWLLDNVEGAREKANNGEILFGTIDTWLLWNLTRGKVHATDYSNASRTMLFNIRELDWDDEILEELNIPRSILPEVKNSSEIYGYTDEHTYGGANIPISGIAGDQQAALFGQTCFEKGMIKNTYGTGCFVLMNTGNKLIESKNGLISTIAWGIDNQITYALEGSVFVAGAAVQWLRDELRLIFDAPESEYHANKVKDSGGVVVVPAFTGLGAPYWNMEARGGIFGITRGTKREHIVRATLESIAFQSKDVIDLMKEESKLSIPLIRVDGGASENNFLMQFQADILDIEIHRPETLETTALGAAYLAGLAVDFWKNQKDVINNSSIERKFSPDMQSSIREKYYSYWKKAVLRTMDWEELDIEDGRNYGTN